MTMEQAFLRTIFVTKNNNCDHIVQTARILRANSKRVITMSLAPHEIDPLQRIKLTRRSNLRFLLSQYGSLEKLGKALGYANGSYVSQLIGRKPIRAISETTARRFEAKLNLPLGWLDAASPNLFLTARGNKR
jgi:hypothetical protein